MLLTGHLFLVIKKYLLGGGVVWLKRSLISLRFMCLANPWPNPRVFWVAIVILSPIIKWGVCLEGLGLFFVRHRERIHGRWCVRLLVRCGVSFPRHVLPMDSLVGHIMNYFVWCERMFVIAAGIYLHPMSRPFLIFSLLSGTAMLAYRVQMCSPSGVWAHCECHLVCEPIVSAIWCVSPLWVPSTLFPFMDWGIVLIVEYQNFV